jgi:hypothetical protein
VLRQRENSVNSMSIGHSTQYLVPHNELSVEFLHAQSHANILSTPFSAAKLHPVSFIIYVQPCHALDTDNS